MENEHCFCVFYTSHSDAFLSLSATCSPQMQEAHMDAADTNINLWPDYLGDINEEREYFVPNRTP